MKKQAKLKPVPSRPHAQYQAHMPYYGGLNYNGFMNQVNGFVNPGYGFINPGNGFVNLGNGFMNPVNGFMNPVNGFMNPVNGFMNPVNFCATEENDNSQSNFVQFAQFWLKNNFSFISSVFNLVKGFAKIMKLSCLAMFAVFRIVSKTTGKVDETQSVFGRILHAVNIFRLFEWLYRKLEKLLGRTEIDQKEADFVWNKAVAALTPKVKTSRFTWLLLLVPIGISFAVPYFIGNYIYSKYKETLDPKTWKSPGYKAEVIQKFDASAPNEISIEVDDVVLVAPAYIQKKMNIWNSGWCFALHNDDHGIIPMNHVKFLKKVKKNLAEKTENDSKVNSSDNDEQGNKEEK